MRKKNLWIALSFCGAMALLSGCGSSDHPSNTGSASAPATSPNVANQGVLKILGFGPNGTKAGIVFNAQASGMAALWVKLNRPVKGADAAIWWGDHRLESVVSGDTVSAVVPADLYAAPGRYTLQVRFGKDGSGAGQSTEVYFVVK